MWMDIVQYAAPPKMYMNESFVIGPAMTIAKFYRLCNSLVLQ